MSAIHHVDPGPVAHRARNAAPTVALTLDDLWPHLHAGADHAQRPDLRGTLDRLADTQPDQSNVVVCHGDLHPLNLLQDDAAGTTTVIDWTGAIIAPAAYDVALTCTFLRNPPLHAPVVLRPAINAGAALITRRFLGRYQQVNPGTDLADLPWYAALHATRILIDLATWRQADDSRAQTHPWHLLAPAAARTLDASHALTVGGR
jgi:aminoglycoside phosphotransferase (APT) family kinase protein